MIIDQIKAYCNCDCVNNDDIEDRDVEELIELVSMATCWMQSPCETFLSAERSEVIELPSCLCDCDVYEFYPFYHPFDASSFNFILVKQEGIEEETFEITEFKYSEVDGCFKIQLPIPSCKCRNICGCELKYKLLVKYVAGYEELPECILPVFCEALQWVSEKNSCGCSDCQACSNETELITADYENGATIADRLADYFIKSLAEQYKRELSLISLCRPRSKVWGFVV